MVTSIGSAVERRIRIEVRFRVGTIQKMKEPILLHMGWDVSGNNDGNRISSVRNPLTNIDFEVKKFNKNFYLFAVLGEGEADTVKRDEKEKGKRQVE
ncbi:hypothetical protein EVAR_83260_1 [Eumeta japonica]|uniref:Uncharacterized protein n=1 Tax=Eumeta variegata TaxID=151549 RepID=A0A4C1X6Y2_EUMVA|nr:hypothetical protein EVAR_83260_1 [Eumeta japonica]